MAGFVIERHGYTNAAALTRQLVQDLLANGFTQIFPTTAFNPTTAGSDFRITMEASGTIDPLNADAVTTKQPWRLTLDLLNEERLFAYVATPLQLTDDGQVAVELSGITGSVASDILGNIGDAIGTSGLTVDGDYTSNADDLDIGLINRTKRMSDLGKGYPLSYRLVLTARGMWLGIWEDAITAESSQYFNWMLVQRPVDRTDGSTLITGKAPVFCVNCVNTKYYQFVVRESDILRPGVRRSASSNTADSEAVLNIQNQVSLSEDGKYIVTFPSRLNTSRYRYPHELDMMGVTSSDVVSQYSDVPLQFYGESTPRVYKALHANGGTNIGMRVLILQSGGGIS